MAETTNTLLSLAADRRKYLMTKMDSALRETLVAEEICRVDRTDSYKIENPYASTPTIAITHFTGTYAVDAWTVTDDTLTVQDEFKIGEHIFDYERIVTQFDMIATRLDMQAYWVANAIDDYVINVVTEGAGESYSTPSGGFTTAANINTIMANLLSKVSGYQSQMNGLFLVIENTDLPGFVAAGAASGFTFADQTLKNGLRNKFNYMGVDVYVVRSGLFDNATSGSETWTNSSHRVFGVKRMATYAHPRGVQYEEKAVSLKTGIETVTWGAIGVKVWSTIANLLVDITIV